MTLVPKKGVELVCSGSSQRVRAALPILSRSQWADWALANAYLQGRGVTLASVPPSDADVDISTDYDMSAYICPNSGILAIIWLITLKPNSDDSASGDFYNVHGSEVLATWALSKEDYAIGKSFRVVQPTSGLTEGIRTLRIRMDAGSADVTMCGATVIELPLPSVGAPDDQSLAPSAPIYSLSDGTVCFDGVINSLPDAMDRSRRASQSSWYNSVPVSTTATTFSSGSIYSYSIIHPRSLYGADTAEVKYAVMCRANGGTGELRVQTAYALGLSSTDSTVQTITSTIYTVYTGSITARTEDVTTLDTDMGLRSSYALASLDARRVTATSVDVLGFWIVEPVPP